MTRTSAFFGKSIAGSGLFSPRSVRQEWHHPLLTDLRELTTSESREVACALSMLWDEYHGEFRGREAEYVLNTRQNAHRVRQVGGLQKMHYALALDLMAALVEIQMKLKRSPQEEELAAAVEQHASRGALIRRAGVRTQRSA